MPKSRRNRVVSLTATKKKPNIKTNLVEEIRKCVDQYPRIFVFRVDDMRNAKLKELRVKLKELDKASRLFFGKNKVMAIALGRSEADEYQEGLHRVSSHLVGQCGLLFSELDKAEVLKIFEEIRDPDYARTGDIASKNIDLQAGPLQFAHNLEPYLRGLGMPTSLQRGVVTLVRDFVVCEKGKPLSSEQARMLKLLEHRLAEFRLKLDCLWSKEKGEFQEFAVVPRNFADEEIDPEEDEEEENHDVNMEAEDKVEDEGKTKTKTKKAKTVKKSKSIVPKSDRSLRSSVSSRSRA